jgi:hypothetical protein
MILWSLDSKILSSKVDVLFILLLILILKRQILSSISLDEDTIKPFRKKIQIEKGPNIGKKIIEIDFGYDFLNPTE